ncbi:MAG: LpxI family protein [Micavibrio sp.]
MPTLPESSITRLGVIAGGGSLPAQLLSACDKKGIEPFIVAFDGQTDPVILKDRRYLLTRLGAAGLIINTLKSQNIRDLVFIGSIRRPSLKEMRPDFRTLKFYTRLAAHALGDDGLLKAMKKELERDGFRLHGVQHFADDLVASTGPMGLHQPKEADQKDIQRGLAVNQSLGRLDIGQGVVVQEGIVLGVEAAEGTDELIRRCGRLKRAGRGPILIKTSKPGQEQDLDLPTIGPNTVINAAENGFSGIVIEAGRTLLSEPDRIAELANKAGIFVIGIEQDL